MRKLISIILILGLATSAYSAVCTGTSFSKFDGTVCTANCPVDDDGTWGQLSSHFCVKKNTYTITDSYNFDIWYKGAGTFFESNISLKWEYLGIGAGQKLKMTVQFPKPTNNVTSRIWLKHTDASTSYIPAFNPTYSDVTVGTATYSQYYQEFPISQFDTLAAFACTRISEDADWDKQTCFGLLSLVHQDWLVANPTDFVVSDAREQNWVSSNQVAYVKFNFRLIVRYNKKVTDTVQTVVITKVNDLPCAHAVGIDQCIRDVAFKLTYTLCDNQAYTSCTAKANSNYVYGDIATILFQLDVKTRNIWVYKIYGIIPTGDSQGVELPNSTHTAQLVSTKPLGQYLLTIPIAGPASTLGSNFNLKFIFQLQSITTRRFLEGKERALQAQPTPVQYVDIQGMNVNGVPGVNPIPVVVADSGIATWLAVVIAIICVAVVGVAGVLVYKQVVKKNSGSQEQAPMQQV